ncbi:hypothetical protein Tco_1525270 [Tanacetum coccineum]
MQNTPYSTGTNEIRVLTAWIAELQGPETDVRLRSTSTAIMCQSLEDNNEDNKDSSWTDWAKGKVAGVFKGDQVKETARHTANHVGDATSDAISEKAIEEEAAAAEEAKKLSGET